MRRIALILVLCASAFAESDDDKIILDPFSDGTVNESYQPPTFNFDFPLFQAGVAAHWQKHGRWPDTIPEVKEGVRIWLDSFKAGENERAEPGKFVDPLDAFEMVETIPMWRGVAYRLVYKKMGRSIPGMIVFAEAESFDEIMKTTRFSEIFGGIKHSVPF